MKSRMSSGGEGGCCKEGFKENGNFLEGVKREGLNRLRWRRSVRNCVCLRRPGTAASC